MILSAARGWTYAAVIGAVAGLLTLWLGMIGAALALIPALTALFRRPRPLGASGMLAGFGAAWLALLGLASARCDPASCVAPDLTPWVAIAGAAVALGALLGAGAVWKAIRAPGS